MKRSIPEGTSKVKVTFIIWDAASLLDNPECEQQKHTTRRLVESKTQIPEMISAKPIELKPILSREVAGGSCVTSNQGSGALLTEAWHRNSEN